MEGEKQSEGGKENREKDERLGERLKRECQREGRENERKRLVGKDSVRESFWGCF